MYLKLDGTISTLDYLGLKLADHFTYLSSNISSTHNDISIRIGKA